MADTNNIKSEWNLKLLFAGDDDPQIAKSREEMVEANYAFINKWKDRTDYYKDPKVLKEALDEFEELTREKALGGKEGYYFWLKGSLNQNDPEIKARNKKIEELAKQIGNDIQFFAYRISKIPLEEQEKFLESPELKEYKHFLENLFAESKYLLSEDEEKILNLVGTTSFGNWVRMVSSFLAKEEGEVVNEKGENETVSFQEIVDRMNDSDKKVRDVAAKTFNEILEKHSDVAESEINSILEFKKTTDKLRGVDRPDRLRHIEDDIDTAVVDSLLESVEKRFDISRRYYELKAKLLGIPKLAYHERNLEIGEADKKYSWEETVELVDKVYSSLDPEFGEIFRLFLKNGQIDAFPKKGKSTGAYCVSFLVSQPVFVLLNHTNKLDNVTTLAHEMGHAVNDTLIMKTQNALNAHSPLSTAEVASTFMEDFVLQEILKEANDELRLSLMMSKLNDDVSTIIRQVAAYRFEQELHGAFREKGYLSKEKIGKIFEKNMEAYMGDFVEQSPGSQNWWVYWGHFRRFFYVYSYASGLLISKSLQAAVKGNPKFIEKVKKLLAAGGEASPKEVFAEVGIDITDKAFWSRGLDEMDTLLSETEKLARKLGKIKQFNRN